MSDPRKPFADALRKAGMDFNRPGVVAAFDDMLDKAGVLRVGQTPGIIDPPWLAHARSKLGQREIKGPKHNGWIAEGWARLGATWFNDDETPWCGYFIADALDAAGLPYPKNFPAAASFRTYGVAVPAQLGAIATMRRPGGNHAFIIVGETPDRLAYKALGGNQSDGVTIMDVPKTQVDAIRWPPGVPLVPRSQMQLPVMPRGTILKNMA
ncbi:MAG: TIGR02594 family protein [Sphingopyxis sp.]|nr:TIGR02594 family protein [Sphingopyxis sp.]